MHPSSIRIARRLVNEMLEVAKDQTDMSMFIGLGLALALCFEEMTARSAKNMKPRELMQWAKELPDERYKRVEIVG